MNGSSTRKKGNRYENFLIERLKEVDTGAKRNYASGSGIDKNDIRLPQFDIEIEAKNAMQVTLCKDFEQLERQTTSNTGVLIIRNPKKAEFQQSFVVMDLEDWLELLKSKTTFNVEQELPKDLKWKLKRLKDYSNDVMKLL